LPAIAWAIFILVLCTSSNGGFVPTNFIGEFTDKFGHAFVFSVLAICLMIGFIKQSDSKRSIKTMRLISASIAGIYGIAIELIQHFFTTDRRGEFNDVVADCVGIGIGLLFVHLIYGKLNALERKQKTQ
jgi:VanZ family protein